MMHALRLQGLRIERGMRTVIDGLSVSVESGTALVLTGPNGAGKTTLLRAIAGFLTPSAGSITLDGIPPETDRAEHCSFLAMADAVKPNLTVLENLHFWAGYLAGRPDAPRTALDRLGLAALLDIRAGYLSSGQRRRLGLARLMLADRPLWLLDEPTVALDTEAINTLKDLINAHLALGGIAVVATHAPLALANEVLLPLVPSARHTVAEFE